MICITPQLAFEIASNIRDGTNPEYTIASFRTAMPNFTEAIIPDEQLQAYIDMAHAVVKEARWHGLWREGMRLFIAHFVTLYLSTQREDPTRSQLVDAGRKQGTATNKSVGQVSVGLDTSQVLGDLTGWGAWKDTAYGSQFATLARVLGKGGMYIP